jgi:hypothetical protein
MASLFGFEFKRVTPEEPPVSFAPQSNDDGAVVVAAGGSYGTYVDLEGTARTEAELVTRYRDMSLTADIDRAVEEIVNEAIVHETDEKIVELNLNSLEIADNIKAVIIQEFNNVKNLLNFEDRSYDVFKRWYIDGRLYYHAIIDEKNPRMGIKELRNIDPRKIRKVREQKKKKDPRSEAVVTQTTKEYYIYNEKGYNAQGIGSGAAAYSAVGVKIAKDAIVHCTSGLMDTNGTMVISYLHKAIKPLNQLRVLEDATVIYRISRAPERRIFYIDVGNLPKMKAEQYLRDMMVRHKNRLVYDATTGEVRDDRKFMTMLEDYWLPRREGGKGTEITTLPGGENLGKMEDVEYFQKKLYQSLNVPATRLQTEQTYSIGRATEITRDEVKFAKFISRMRAKFSTLFLKCLEKQLVLKGIVTVDDWKQMSQYIKFDYAKDNYYEELKETDVLNSRLQAANQLTPYVGKYYSHSWIRSNIFKQSDEDRAQMDQQIKEELSNQIYYPPPPQEPQQ